MTASWKEADMFDLSSFMFRSLVAYKTAVFNPLKLKFKFLSYINALGKLNLAGSPPAASFDTLGPPG